MSISKLSLRLSLAFILVAHLANAQGILKTAYCGLSVGRHCDISQNTAVSVGSQSFYPGTDKTTAAFAGNYSILIGLKPFKNVFVETGFGVYRTIQSFSTKSPVIGTYYKNPTLISGWSCIPVKIGYGMVNKPTYNISAFIGVNLLIDRIKSLEQHPGDEPGALDIKKTKSPIPSKPGYAAVYMNHYAFFSELFVAGVRGEYLLNKHLSVEFDLNMNLGIRALQSGAAYTTELQADGTPAGESHYFSTTSGSGAGTTIGFNYRICKR